MYKKKTRKLLSFLLTLVLLIPLWQGIMPERVAEAATTLHNPRTGSDGVTTWDKVKFGNYYQTAKFKPEPIKWRVLSVNGDDAFLLADECLNCKPYNTKEEDVTWETCSLRKWLNEDFYNEAFDSSEQAAIIKTAVVNKDNPQYGTPGGNDTMDHIYLLSVDEACNADYGFAVDSARESENTDYAKCNHAYTNINANSNGNETSDWWLRSLGNDSSRAKDVESDYIGPEGSDVYNNEAVRPVLHLNLSSSVHTDAGEVDSEGNVTNKDDGISAPKKDSNGVTTWDCVYLGNYKQTAEWKKEPIEWRVLSVNGDDAFLLADKCLDGKPYNAKDEDVTWETCSLRKWLNEDFYSEAFNSSEREAIMKTTVVTGANPEYGTAGGNDTVDRIYLLSVDEVCNTDYGFASEIYGVEETRQAKNTDYAECNNAHIWNSSDGTGIWYLRSPGDFYSNVSYVKDDGYVYEQGDWVDFYEAVRPALHLDLSSTSNWSYAGTVNSEGEVDETGVTKPAEPGSTGKPSLPPTLTPGETSATTPTPKPSAPAPTPGKPSQPVTSSVTPFVPQQSSVASPVSGISPDSGKNTVEKVTALKLKQKKHTVTASWKKLTGVKGYQICYSTSKKWKGKKQKLVTKNNAVIKNLKKQKTYYFRVQAYRIEGTKKVYGAWSSVKKIKIKK